MAAAAEQLDGLPANLFRQLAGEQFRHRLLVHGFAAGVQQGGGGEGQASRGFDGGRHVGELERHRLMVGQPVAEGLALLDIVARGFERRAGDPHALGCRRYAAVGRSEEHTSELQSLMRISYAVFCLKKKTTKQQSEITTSTHKRKTNE